MEKAGVRESDCIVECIYKERTAGAGGMGAAGAGVKFTGNPINKIRKRKMSSKGAKGSIEE